MFLQSWKIRQAFERGEEYTTSSSIVAREEEDFAKISVHWNLTCREEAKQTAKKSSTLEDLFAAAFLQQPVPEPEADLGWLQLKGCGLHQEEIKTTTEPVRKEIKENDCKKESNRKISDKDCIPCRGAGRANLLVYLPCRVCNGTGLNSEYQKLKEEKEERERIKREKLREAIRKEKEAKATESEQKSISEERQEELADISSSENETTDEEAAWEEEKKREMENECWEKQKRGEKEGQDEEEEGVISEYVYWNICVKREKRVIPRPSFIPPLDLRALEGVEREDPGVILHRHRPVLAEKK